MTYQENVAAAAAALKLGDDANWKLARLTFEVCGPPGNVGRTAKAVSLSTWATDVAQASGRKFSLTTASYFRDIWCRFGFHQGETQTTWTDAYAEIRGGTVGERMVEADLNRFMNNASPELKGEAVQRLAEDPAVVDVAIEKPETKQALYDGIARHGQTSSKTFQPDTPTFGEFREQILQKIPGPNGRTILFDGLQQLEVLSRWDDVAWLTENVSAEDAEMIERDIPRYINWLTRVRDAARRSTRRMELVK